MFMQLYKMSTLVLGVILFTPTSSKTNRISGGEPIDISECGWQVSVQAYGIHLCGGSIIDKNWIVTAAQCVLDDDFEPLSVRVGSTNHESGGTVYNINKAIRHPKYNSDTFDYDIALIRVSEPIRLTVCKSRPVKFYKDSDEVAAGTMAQVLGWGAEQAGGPDFRNLRQAWIPIVEHKICEENYTEDVILRNVTERMICAGFPNGGANSCTGDSGGPLLDNKQNLIGIVSWGTGCGLPNKPGVYTKIHHPEIEQFIQANILKN